MLEDYEEFSEEEQKILNHYVTNTDLSIFALKNLPEVIKGALFSRYSRSKLGLRSLLLKEFVSGDDDFQAMVGHSLGDDQKQLLAIQKAQNFYDRILDGYGDDSIGELGGAHLAVENVSMLAAKAIQDSRIGGSPLEKSTRYITFDQKVKGEYLYYRDPTLLASAHKQLYIETCDQLFEIYSSLIPPLTEKMQKEHPQEEGTPTGAYKAAIRAKVLDCLRGILPASTLTNMGMFGNGRFFEGLIHKLSYHSLGELQEVAKGAHGELSKIIPSFVRRSDSEHKTFVCYNRFYEEMDKNLEEVSKKYVPAEEKATSGVRLLNFDLDGVKKVAAALLFEKSAVSFEKIQKRVEELSEEELEEILGAASDARTMRRHKSPRALEHAFFTFEIVADFGAFRDMHRHRMLTQERQELTCDLDYYFPKEILGTEMEAPYRKAMLLGKEAFDRIRCELPVEAQYVVPMAYNIRWYFHLNLRALQWVTELRSGAAGHPAYRLMAQEMARQVFQAVPQFERFFKFVDFEGYDLGRMGQEKRREEKKKESILK